MSASVNSVFSEPIRPFDYVIKKEIYRHPLVNMTLFKTPVNGKKIKDKSGKCLHWLIVQAREQKTSDTILVSNNYFVKTIDCSYRTITRALSDLQENGYIIRKSIIKSDGKICRTTNHFEICWLKLFHDYGESLFADLMENMVTFIKGRIARAKELLSPLCRPFCPTDKPISSNEDIYNNNIYGNLLKFGVISMEQEVLLKGEYEKTPLDELLEENEAENRSYFNRDIRVCPDQWREIALKEGMSAEYIDDEFIEFRDYWISLGKVKYAKKANWSRTWMNRIKDVIHSARTRYKSVAYQNQQAQWKQKLQDNSKNFSLLTNHNVSASPEACAPEYMHWNKELTNEGFWKVSGSPDYSQFTAFYTGTGKGADIMDSKNGWLQRWAKWHERSAVAHKSPAVKAYGETKVLDIKIPDEFQDIHKRLVRRMEEQNYVSWVQSPKVIIKKHPSPTDQYLYVADYTGIGNAFAKKTVSERYRSDFEDLKIEII